MSELIRKEACPECQKNGGDTSEDNLAVYDNGVYCFACGYTTRDESAERTETVRKKKVRSLIPIGEYKAIKNRGISLETAKKYKLTVAEYKGESVLCMSYYEGGAIVAQKLKFKKVDGKSKYLWLGDKTLVSPLWGMNVYEPNEKLSITICEGEMDMLCRSTLNDDKWPCVSLVDGAGKQALKGISKAKEYLTGFKRVVLMFDGDEVGRKTAQKAAELIGNKARIVSMPDGEDVCSMFQAGRGDEINKLEMCGVAHHPKDIVTVGDYSDEELYSKESAGIPIPFPKLNSLLRGLKPASLYMLCAGSGLGKSSLAKEMAYDLMFKQGIRVGCIFLEQETKSAMKDFIALDHNIEAEDFNQDPTLVSEEGRAKSKAKLEEMGVFYKYFGSLNSESLISKIEYIFQGCECDFVILDHISMIVSGESSDQGERKMIDILMTKLRTMIQATGKSVIAISHLKRPSGESRDYNNGGQVNLSSLRGSASIEQISDYVIGMERNQFDEMESNVTKLKVLKCRRGGRIGYADTLEYSFDTGRLTVVGDNRNEKD